MVKELQLKIMQLIGVLDYLIFIDNFSAYKRIKLKYVLLYNTLESLNEKDMIGNKEILRIIENVSRLLCEAPPKDLVLGKYILDLMQNVYETLNKLILN